MEKNVSTTLMTMWRNNMPYYVLLPFYVAYLIEFVHKYFFSEGLLPYFSNCPRTIQQVDRFRNTFVCTDIFHVRINVIGHTFPKNADNIETDDFIHCDRKETIEDIPDDYSMQRPSTDRSNLNKQSFPVYKRNYIKPRRKKKI
ncbi:hypothetical protein AVEN_252343-1 [Araneus ventricosus]|uniref:Uncharacterized protein n=1 Tax=Araneus ventricosus TaxID=182803 RepID=A0A4Y2ASQ0_ARAVE|nr:hypothetical protein AVEN_252343-1 [Araneus ventricosus]